MKTNLENTLRAFGLSAAILSTAATWGTTPETGYVVDDRHNVFMEKRALSWKKEEPWFFGLFGEDKTTIEDIRITDRVLVCPFPNEPLWITGEDPAARTMLAYQLSTHAKDLADYALCLREVNKITPEINDRGESLSLSDVLDKQILWAEQKAKEEQAAAEKAKAEDNKAHHQKVETIGVGSKGSGGSAVITYPPTGGSPTIKISNTCAPAYTPWVKEQIEQIEKTSFNKKTIEGLKEYLPKLKKEGSFQGYSVKRVGSVGFEECDTSNPEGIESIVEKLKEENLEDAILVLYGSADSLPATKCPSGTNDDLSVHRAGSIMVALEREMVSKIYRTHIDVIAGGDAENRRAVDIYLLRMEPINNPFE